MGAPAAIVLASLTLTGCASSILDGIWGDDTEASTKPGSSVNSVGDAVAPDLESVRESTEIAKLYNAGLSDLQARNYVSAAKDFAEVERQYPYSTWATKAILMQSYAYYQKGSYDDAINAANRFITLHPGHKDAAYAYYMVALADYVRIADIKRDQQATDRALNALEEVERRYPGTPYAADAARKVIAARDHLAGREMEIGRYYYKRGAYLAGINRFKRVVSEYQNSTQTPEALYRLAEGYMALGVVSEAQTAAAVLGHNYPNSQWYKDAYELVARDGEEPVASNESWITKTFKSLNPL